MSRQREPERWLEDTHSDTTLRELMAAATEDAPSPRAVAAAPLAITALLSSSAAGAGAGAGLAAGTLLKPATLSTLALAKWFAAGIGAGAAVAVLAHTPELERAEQKPAPARAPLAPVSASPRASVAQPAAAPSASAAATPVVSAPPRSAPRPDLARELALLDGARAALVGGDAARALSELDALERLPGRALVPEATVLRVRALLAHGERPEAERVAQRFYRNAAGSPQAVVLRGLLDEPKAGNVARESAPK